MNKTVNKDLILIGSGGCMRELVWQIQEFNKNSTAWNILGYIDSLPPEKGMSVSIGLQEVPYLGDDDYLLKQSTQINAAICVGSPGLRKKIAVKLSQNPCIQFPNLILGNTQICQDVVFGKGCIVSMDVRISTNVTVGDFVFFNTLYEQHNNVWLFNECTKHIHNDTIFVFEGIKASRKMRKFWKEVCAHPEVTVTIDLYSMGIVFFNKKLHKRDYIVYF